MNTSRITRPAALAAGAAVIIASAVLFAGDTGRMRLQNATDTNLAALQRSRDGNLVRVQFTFPCSIEMRTDLALVLQVRDSRAFMQTPPLLPLGTFKAVQLDQGINQAELLINCKQKKIRMRMQNGWKQSISLPPGTDMADLIRRLDDPTLRTGLSIYGRDIARAIEFVRNWPARPFIARHDIPLVMPSGGKKTSFAVFGPGAPRFKVKGMRLVLVMRRADRQNNEHADSPFVASDIPLDGLSELGMEQEVSLSVRAPDVPGRYLARFELRRGQKRLPISGRYMDPRSRQTFIDVTVLSPWAFFTRRAGRALRLGAGLFCVFWLPGFLLLGLYGRERSWRLIGLAFPVSMAAGALAGLVLHSAAKLPLHASIDLLIVIVLSAAGFGFGSLRRRFIHNLRSCSPANLRSNAGPAAVIMIIALAVIFILASAHGFGTRPLLGRNDVVRHMGFLRTMSERLTVRWDVIDSPMRMKSTWLSFYPLGIHFLAWMVSAFTGSDPSLVLPAAIWLILALTPAMFYMLLRQSGITRVTALSAAFISTISMSGSHDLYLIGLYGMITGVFLMFGWIVFGLKAVRSGCRTSAMFFIAMSPGIFYCHMPELATGVFMLGILSLAELFTRRITLRTWLVRLAGIAVFSAALCLAFYLPFYLQQAHRSVGHTLLAINRLPVTLQRTLQHMHDITFAGNPVFIMAAIFGIVISLAGARRNAGRAAMIATALVPILLIIALHFRMRFPSLGVFTTIFYHRYHRIVTFLNPALSLGTAVFLTSLARVASGYGRPARYAIFSALLVLGISLQAWNRDVYMLSDESRKTGFYSDSLRDAARFDRSLRTFVPGGQYACTYGMLGTGVIWDQFSVEWQIIADRIYMPRIDRLTTILMAKHGIRNVFGPVPSMPTPWGKVLWRGYTGQCVRIDRTLLHDQKHESLRMRHRVTFE